MARMLLDAHADGRLRVTMSRASDYYGPGGVNSAAGTSVFASAVKARPPAGWDAWTCRTL
jgi:hypothetical protein